MSVLLIALCFTVVGCQGNSNDDGDDGPAYEVGEPVTDSTVALIVTSEFGTDTLQASAYRQQYDRSLQQYGPMMAQLPGEQQDQRRKQLRRRLIDGFIMNHVAQGQLNAMNFEPEVDTAQVMQQVEARIEQLQQRPNFEQALEQQGLTLDSVRAQLMGGMMQQAMQAQKRERLMEYFTESVGEVTSTQIDTFRENRRQEEVRAQHILFSTDESMSETQLDSVQQEAQAVLQQVNEGGDFGELAREYSQGPSSSRGGDLGWFSRERMVEPFADAAFALADSGDVASEPVKTRFGYHLIRLTGRRTSPPMDSTRAAGMLAQQMEQEAVEEGLRELEGKATVRPNPSVIQVDLSEPRTQPAPPQNS